MHSEFGFFQANDWRRVGVEQDRAHGKKTESAIRQPLRGNQRLKWRLLQFEHRARYDLSSYEIPVAFLDFFERLFYPLMGRAARQVVED